MVPGGATDPYARLIAERMARTLGRVFNAVAITNGTRSRFLPSIPTFAELGHGEFTTNVWFGLMLRAGTPPDTVASL